MLSISQFSKIARVTTKTLRYYDEIELLKPAQVDDENGYRYYDSQQLVTVMQIQKLKMYEFSLSEIKAVLENQAELPMLLEIKKRNIANKLTDYSSIYSTIEADITNLAEGGVFMLNKKNNVIELVESPEMNLLSIRKKMNVKDFGEVMGELLMKIAAKKLEPIGPPMTIYHSPEYTPDDYDMEIAIPVKESLEGTRLLPSMQCAKLKYIGVYEELPQAYAELTQWIEANGYEINNAPFDVYVTDPQTTLPENSEMAIYFPIVIK